MGSKERLQKMRERYLQKKQESAERTKTFRIKGGDSHVRLIPAKNEDDWWYVEGRAHYYEKRYRWCRAFDSVHAVESKQRCPLCELSEEMRASSHEEDFQFGKGIAPRERYVANIINRKDEEAGPKIMEFGRQVWDGINHEALGGEDESMHFVIEDPADGYDILITRTGSGLGTDYKVKTPKASTPLGTHSQIKKWIEEQEDLLAYVKPMDEERMEALISGGDVPAVGEEAEPKEEGPSPETATPKKDFWDDDKKSEEEPPEEEAAPEEAPEEEAVNEETGEVTEAEAISKMEGFRCFGDPNQHDPKDSVCQECEYFKECAGEIAKAAPPKKKTPPKKAPPKKEAPKKAPPKKPSRAEALAAMRERLEKTKKGKK